MEQTRCHHFSIEVEEIRLSNAPVVLRVPIRRCALAERMMGLLAATETAQEIVGKLTIGASKRFLTGSTEEPDQESETEAIHVAFGPDLEAIHPNECTVQRCLQSCTPGFRMILSHFGLQADAESETGKGCLEDTTSASDADALITPSNDN
ncbi:MAG TPA: hypothetical protein VFB38_26450 [Chthonomonadaceae bacterium]|nr:hypothetical protein [Chthonomonadaceae bacterium]